MYTADGDAPGLARYGTRCMTAHLRSSHAYSSIINDAMISSIDLRGRPAISSPCTLLMEMRLGAPIE